MRYIIIQNKLKNYKMSKKRWNFFKNQLKNEKNSQSHLNRKQFTETFYIFY